MKGHHRHEHDHDHDDIPERWAGGLRNARMAGLGLREFGPAFGPGFRDRMRRFAGGRAPRGNVRAATLLLLEEQPRNGYQVMQEITERSKGVWRPSPGSVYPALQQLEDEGLVRSQESDGQRLFTLTEQGRTYTEEHRAEFGLPWEQISGSVGDDVHELLGLMRHTAEALVQVAHAGTPAQVAKASQLLKETRRGLYQILAEDDTPTAEG